MYRLSELAEQTEKQMRTSNDLARSDYLRWIKSELKQAKSEETLVSGWLNETASFRKQVIRNHLSGLKGRISNLMAKVKSASDHMLQTTGFKSTANMVLQADQSILKFATEFLETPSRRELDNDQKTLIEAELEKLKSLPWSWSPKEKKHCTSRSTAFTAANDRDITEPNRAAHTREQVRKAKELFYRIEAQVAPKNPVSELLSLRQQKRFAHARRRAARFAAWTSAF
ncbi:hypothetical protein T439DRAFT_328070 [Meredithblackwellia eburnea MCA 4105]